jgi:tRNA nucleotidyltransferase (CCA-adding enzyme)
MLAPAERTTCAMTQTDRSPATRDIPDPCLPSGTRLLDLFEELRAAGGKPLIVGGWVRDRLMGETSTNLDIEVFHLSPERLEAVLSRHGELRVVGKAFAVYRIAGLDVEFSIPRLDSKTAEGHKGFVVQAVPDLSFEEAARRRDFTVNAMGFDPETGEVYDPWGGAEHLRAGILEVVEPKTFPDDPLRVLRGAQFLSRFLLTPGPHLLECSRRMNANGLPQERVFGELTKMLFGKKPSLGARFLLLSGWLRFFPEWASLVGVPQDATWHPEGDVWAHSLLALDEAVKLKEGHERRDIIFLYGVLCHDFGKASTTTLADGRIRSIGHTKAGAAPTRQFMERLTQDKWIVRGVEKLVNEHLTPLFLHNHGAGAGAIRRLARRLAPEADVELLERCARADYLASGDTDDRVFAPGAWLLEMAREHLVTHQPEEPVLKGRHLVAVGISPGPLIGRMLERAYEIQTEHGEKRIEVLRNMVLEEFGYASRKTDDSG